MYFYLVSALICFSFVAGAAVVGYQRVGRMNTMIENTLLAVTEANTADRVFIQLQVIDLQLAILRDFAIFGSIVLSAIFLLLVAWTVLKF